jgi:hypothetical protein
MSRRFMLSVYRVAGFQKNERQKRYKRYKRYKGRYGATL